MDAEAAVVGAGVVGCATALALARRGVGVVVLEAADEPGLAASGTNSGILHTGFDSPPGELETELILRAAALRDAVLEALSVPVLRSGALLRPLADEWGPAVAEYARNAERNGVEATLRDDGSLVVPGESVTNPVAFTLALAAAAERHGAELRMRFEAVAVERMGEELVISSNGGDRVSCRVAVNCAGVGAGAVARAAGDGSFDVYPRKGEFVVFDPPGDEPLERILLPVPEAGTKGVLVFPTVDGKVIAGPTAVDQEDPRDWSVRPEAPAEILPKAAVMYPPLEGAEPIFAYAGLRPAGRAVNYLIERSRACDRLVNAAAIRSTGLTASLAIAERVCSLVADAGVAVGPEAALEPGTPVEVEDAWWRRTAEHWAHEMERA